jgi:hypothetical protein
MLRDLTIKNYRCFKDFSIDGLARVNLIVGKNNSGKTSFLEAVYLLVSQQNPLSLLEILRYRGEFIPTQSSPGLIHYQVQHLFHGHDPKPNLKMPWPDTVVNIISHESRLSFGMRLSPAVAPLSAQQLSILRDVVRDQLLAYELLLSYGEADVDRLTSPANHRPKAPVSRDYHLPARDVNLRDVSSHQQFVTTDAVDFEYLGSLWDGITLTDKEVAVIQALRTIEPGVERLNFTSRQSSAGGILVKLSAHPFPVPLSSLGEGMRRILALAMSAVTAEQGILLVDEIDTGLYHGTLTQVWRLLIETAQRLNVQIFATTHSWDCVAAFQEALADRGDEVGMLFRLQQREGTIQAVKYDAEDLDVAVRQAIEVR